MNDLPRQQLRKLIATYGRSLCNDPRQCEALLKDFCHGQYRREISVLVGALKERVAADLLASQNSEPHEVLLARLARRLHDNLALADDAALWAVESWALALGVSPPPVPPQYRQDNIIQEQAPTIIREQPPTSSEVVSNPRGRTQPQLSATTQQSQFNVVGSSPGPSRPSSWKTLGILGIAAVAVVIVLHYLQPRPSHPISTTAPSLVENTPSPKISETQQPSATQNDRLFVYRLRYISGSIPYEAILSVKGNYGTLRTTFNDRGQTRIVDQTISYRRMSQDLQVIAGSNPVIAGTNVQDTNYSPDNFYIETESNRSKIFFTCDQNAIQAQDKSRCSPVKVEEIR